ncbi:MAG: hypothetical protein AB8C46_13310 [Burkholderiaceae bacterium]
MPESIDKVAKVFQGAHQRYSLILLAVVVWLILCLPPLLSNRPDSFQASGSIIVVVAILIYARERTRRESEVSQAQRIQIVALLDEHENWGAYHESQVIRSAMENELALLQ